MTNQSDKLVIFQDKKIRRVWHNDEWYFSVADIIAILTDSNSPGAYWRKLKERLLKEGSSQTVTNCHSLKMTAGDNKRRLIDALNTENIFRLIQSIPSPKAEPFKRWLATVGYERIQEIENPELAQDRMKLIYEQKGYTKDWIDKRLRGIAIRQELTDEWKKRGVEEQREYAILTNEISQATFGVPIKIHKEIKKLDPKFKNQNLRDHMTDLELIFSMLGEKLTTEATRKKEVRGFTEGLETAKEGGSVAGRARQDAEKTFGIKVVSPENHSNITKKKKLGKKTKAKNNFKTEEDQ